MAPWRGVNVPIGEVSVIPQPSKIGQPTTLSHRFLTATGPADPPDAHKRSDEKSILPISGRLRIATCIVGTPI